MSPFRSSFATSVPRRTCRCGFTCGRSRSTRYPASTLMSYPSSRRRWRSGLRLIGRCDIEDHAVFRLHGVAGVQAPLLVAVTAVVGGGKDPVRAARRVVVGEAD